MRRLDRKALIVFTGLSFVSLFCGMAKVLCNTTQPPPQHEVSGFPIIISHKGSAAELQRPPVSFDHDRHTAALKENKGQDCSICHILKAKDNLSGKHAVSVFKFPKSDYDAQDKTSIMYAYHNECAGCHKKMTGEGKKTGPELGLCGKCHVKKPPEKIVKWTWQPIFNYLGHYKHVQAIKTGDQVKNINIADTLEIIGELTGNRCEVCHHTYDEKTNKLIYKANSENSCRSCHKTQDEKNARSISKVAHAACIGCHEKLAATAQNEPAPKRVPDGADRRSKRFGPIECKGCHGEHKELTAEELSKIPRLSRGQADMMDLAFPSTPEASAKVARSIPQEVASVIRMKAVPFNHKAHEPRTQFCNTCHHHSLEKCQNCHSPQGDARKGGGISYERAFHQAGAQQSCVGCHDTAKESQQCAGCHQWLAGERSKSTCHVCHRGPSGGIVIEAASIPPYQASSDIPEKVKINVLEREFKPAEFTHLKIINKLVSISNGSSLARWFHAAREQSLCSGCHHRSDMQHAAVKVPKCGTCHGRSFDPNNLGKPGILAAYHRQCIGCHEAMGQPPRALECSKCHAFRKGARPGNLIAPIGNSN